MKMELSNGKGPSRVNLGFVEPWTKDVFALGFVLPWSCVEAYQGRALDFVNPYGSASAKVGFDESCVQCKYCALTYTPLTKWQVLETRWCLSVGFTKGGPWVSQALWRIDQGIFRLGF